mgnify:CR=1 FL=1
MTERLARSITALLDDCSPEDITVECHDLLREQAAGIKVDEETVVVIGMPVYVGKIPLPAAEALRKISGNGAMTIASVSYGGRSYGNALFELKSLAEDCGFRPIGAGAFLISCMARRGGSHGFATALDGEAMTEFSKAAAAKIRRLAGCEIEELKRMTRSFKPLICSQVGCTKRQSDIIGLIADDSFDVINKGA